MKKLKNLINEAKKYFENVNGCHDWGHIERVKNLALHIGKIEGADLEVLEISSYLHDIGRDEEYKSKGKICHVKFGTKLAKEILEKYDLDKEKKQNILHSISTHSFRKGVLPQTLEAKILFDADKLDSIGATGIGRAFLFAGGVGTTLHNKSVDIENTKSYTKEDTAYREFLVKLSKIKDKMFTSEGKKLALERHNFMQKFFDRLNKEVDGEI